MNIRQKTLSAGLALVMGAGAANATIATGGNGSGELFLSVWDQTATKSYNQDLGVDLARFLTDATYQYSSNTSWSIPLNSVWSSFFVPANAGNMVYNVAGARTDNIALNALDPTYGYLSSFNPNNPLPPVQAPLSAQLGSVQLPALSIVAKAQTYNGADPVNDAQNDAKVWLSSEPGYFNTDWGNNFKGTVPTTQINDGKFGSLSDAAPAVFHGLFGQLIFNPETEGDTIGDRFVVLPGKFQVTATGFNYVVPISL